MQRAFGFADNAKPYQMVQPLSAGSMQAGNGQLVPRIEDTLIGCMRGEQEVCSHDQNAALMNMLSDLKEFMVKATSNLPIAPFQELQIVEEYRA